MNERIDVLAVMDNFLDPESAPHQPHDLREALAVVAELIEATHQLIALDDCESPCDPACVYCRIRAALARVGAP